jgi:hypothetical protein
MPIDKAGDVPNLPSISVPILGRIHRETTADCPVCGGDLDLSQPNPHDGSGAELIGVCLYCDRLCYVVTVADTVAVAMLLPSHRDVTTTALGALQQSA